MALGTLPGCAARDRVSGAMATLWFSFKDPISIGANKWDVMTTTPVVDF
jgi:hypothetical protein